MLVPIPGQLAPMAPAPMPTGLTFEGSQQGHTEGQEDGDNQRGGQSHDQYQGQQGNGAGEGNNEGEEDYYSFDYPPVSMPTLCLHFFRVVFVYLLFCQCMLKLTGENILLLASGRTRSVHTVQLRSATAPRW